MKHSKVLLSGILFVALTACAQTTDGSWSALAGYENRRAVATLL